MLGNFFFFFGNTLAKAGIVSMGIWQNKDLIWGNGDINVCTLLAVR